MSNSREGPNGADAAHLDDVPDGMGCAEIWERLSARRAANEERVHGDLTHEPVSQEGD